MKHLKIKLLTRETIKCPNCKREHKVKDIFKTSKDMYKLEKDLSSKYLNITYYMQELDLSFNCNKCGFKINKTYYLNIGLQKIQYQVGFFPKNEE